jgi:hypothetical protein
LPSLVPAAFKHVLDDSMARFARTRDPGEVVATIRTYYDLLRRP